MNNDIKRMKSIWSGMNRREKGDKERDIKYVNKGIAIDRVLWPTFTEFARDMYDDYVEHVKIYTAFNTQIDRIDNNKGYSPSNCRWATRELQARNRDSTRWVEYQGEKYPISVLSKKLFGNRGTINTRLLAGKTLEEAILTPKKGLYIDYQGARVNVRMLSLQLFGCKWTIKSRLDKGWDAGRAINTPIRRF